LSFVTTLGNVQVSGYLVLNFAVALLLDIT